MSFEVRMKNRTKMIVLRALCALMIAVILWFINLDVMRETLMRDGGYLIFVGFLGFFLLFFAFSFYGQRRPRIEVNGRDITFYPLWRPSKEVALWEITARKEKPDYYDPKQTAIAGVLGGGLLAYAVMKMNSATMPIPNAMIYTYYRGNTKLITVSTRNMENAERFDQMVADHLEGKTPGTAAETPAVEVEPAEKTRLPLILAGILGAVCVVAAAAVMLAPRTAPRSPDLLAGTSWIANNDGSQWVFENGRTFHWYQTKGETDDNYFAGTYEFHIGRDALDYLTTELSRYAVTEKEMLDVISRGPAYYTLDNLVCFSCVNQSFMLNGEEQLSEETVSSYFGFLLLDGTYLDIANMTTGTYYGFTKE